MDDMLANHVGVITGAAGGLGSATAQCFADHGASVVLIDLDADGVKAVKAALEILARQIAIEWGPLGIRANTVCPGMMRAPLSTQFYADPPILRARESMVALNRIADPREIAEVVAFFASPRASFVTGQSIDVDGGMSQMVTKLLPRPAPAQTAAAGRRSPRA
jgi:NAD(P)-dependent dehydrogenase (short-subunit alcohol dehydrogenase family)